MELATKLVAIRVDERLLERIDQEVAAERQEKGEPTIKRSSLIRTFIREALKARGK